MNTLKLKGKIVEKGKNISDLAEAVGVNRATFYRKMAAQGETFTIGEAKRIVAALEISKDEANEIFLS